MTKASGARDIGRGRFDLVSKNRHLALDLPQAIRSYFVRNLVRNVSVLVADMKPFCVQVANLDYSWHFGGTA